MASFSGGSNPDPIPYPPDPRAQAEQRLAAKMYNAITTADAGMISDICAKLAAEEIAKAAEYMHPKPWPEHEEMDRMWAKVCADAEKGEKP